MAAIMFDFLTRLINVTWKTGLAVEFGDKAEDAPKPEDEKPKPPP